MIGDKYLEALSTLKDEDSAFNQLIELLTKKDKGFLSSLDTPLDLNSCTKKEIIFLTKAAALIDYHLQVLKMEVPSWLRDPILVFDKPYFHPKKMSDFEKVLIQIESPGPLKARNVYSDLRGIRKI